MLWLFFLAILKWTASLATGLEIENDLFNCRRRLQRISHWHALISCVGQTLRCWRRGRCKDRQEKGDSILIWLLGFPLMLLLLSHIRLFATPWIAACQASLSFTISQSSRMCKIIIMSGLYLPTEIYHKKQMRSPLSFIKCKVILLRW